VITEPDPAPVPTDAGVPTTMQPMAADGITMERTVDNDWGAGYCYTYQLRNTTAAPVTWSVPLEVRGKMNNHWQCKVTGESGQVMFTGEDYNQTIPPNGMAEFGFCAVVN
jgi:cellulose 1,4-beta-cellobiosidase